MHASCDWLVVGKPCYIATPCVACSTKVRVFADRPAKFDPRLICLFENCRIQTGALAICLASAAWCNEDRVTFSSLFNNACKLSLVIYCKSRAFCPGSGLRFHPIKLHVLNGDVDMIKSTNVV